MHRIYGVFCSAEDGQVCGVLRSTGLLAWRQADTYLLRAGDWLKGSGWTALLATEVIDLGFALSANMSIHQNMSLVLAPQGGHITNQR
jgi:hypothetical protein